MQVQNLFACIRNADIQLIMAFDGRGYAISYGVL